MSEALHPSLPRPRFRVLLAVSLLAASTLGIQVGLTRFFSYLYWHHFAFMIIGVGLLGFGAAGGWLARGGGVEPGPSALRYAARAGLAATVAILVFLVLGPLVEFAPLRLMTQKKVQFTALFCLYVLIMMPFTALGLAQGAVLAAYRARAHWVYAMDLLGAGLGCLSALAVLSVLPAESSLLAWGACAALAGVLLSWGIGRWTTWMSGAGCALAVLLIATGWAAERPFVMAPSKEIARTRKPIEYTTSSATIRLDVTPVLNVPFMFGGNTDWPKEERRLPTRIIFQDAAALTLMFGIEDPVATPYLGYTSQSLAYQIRERPRVCIIGSGGGPDVNIALHHQAESVTAVELHPEMMAMGRDRYPDHVHGLFERPQVTPVVAEGRHFLARTEETYDVIQMSGVDTFAALVSGAHAMAESYLYTVESGTAILESLEPDGLFTSSRWILDPPRETLRLAGVLMEALRRDGAENPEDHLFVMKAEAWATTLVSRRPFQEEELATLRRWVADRGWTVVLDPDGTGDAPFVALAHAPEAEREAFFADYPYTVDPVTDDSPFFFQFYRWNNLFSGERSRGGYEITRIPVGYAVLIASLLQMALLSVICILGPLWSQRSQLSGQPHLLRRFGFFGAVGTGFMVVEITGLQMFTVFLGHPIYSMAVTLASLLVFSGLGSALAGRSKQDATSIVRNAVIVITVWVALTVFLLDTVLAVALPWSQLARACLVALWLVPVGLALGMPFPTAIRALREEAPGLVPWVWGTNACFSVLASVATALVAMEIGFRATLVVAVAIYWGGFAVWRTTVGRTIVAAARREATEHAVAKARPNRPRALTTGAGK